MTYFTESDVVKALMSCSLITRSMNRNHQISKLGIRKIDVRSSKLDNKVNE